MKVRKNYNYKIVAAKDLEGHAELKTSVVKQRMSINFTAPADLLKFYLEQLSFDVVEFGEPLRKWILYLKPGNSMFVDNKKPISHNWHKSDSWFADPTNREFE